MLPPTSALLAPLIAAAAAFGSVAVMAVAKALCVRCPVREICLEYALEVRETHGIWGGLNEMERRAVLRDRARQAG